MRLSTFFIIGLLVACDGDTQSDSPLCSGDTLLDESSGVIWGSNSQRIVMERFNGFTPDPSDRYDTFDRSRDTLSTCAKNMLSSLQLVDELSCHSDEVTFDVVVTDESGLDKRYVSSNAACGNASDIEGYFYLDDMTDAVMYIESQ